MTKNSLKESIKNPARYELCTGDSRPVIVDTEGIDDYWFLDDMEEVEQLVLLLNHYETTIKILRKVVATNPKCYKSIKEELLEALRINDWEGLW